MGAPEGWWTRDTIRGSTMLYDDFRVSERWSGKELHCIYQALIIAISTRHADAVDVKFLVNGKSVWIALPHPAWVEYKNRTGRDISDPLAVQAAGHYLKDAINSGLYDGREIYALGVEETLRHIDRVIAENTPGTSDKPTQR
jgi:hypothetical protein